MKKNNLQMMILALSVMIMAMVGFNVSAKAADIPYPQPTRAIYYTIPTMRGDDVKWVQEALNRFGNYGLSIDGSFGPACKEATRKFQASRGLDQDGSFGPATRANMVSWLKGEDKTGGGGSSNNDIPYPQPTRAIYYTIPTMRGDDVKWVQEALNRFGNYGLSIDGSFGPACKEATRKFQASRGLDQDGSFGSATRANMISWLKGSNTDSNPDPQPSITNKSFYKQSSGGCYTASAAMIMTNLGATWNGKSATYWNVYAANGNRAWLDGSTPGKFGCSKWDTTASKQGVIDAIKQYPQGVMVAFSQPNRGKDHCMVCIGVNSNKEPLFYDPAWDNGTNNGNGFTLAETSASNYGANWNTIKQVSIINK